ncbi:MAG: hypothetical protein COA63_014290 [Methylophaga sp.]|nr:hypothetical protein [Methylophaga sp.]
MGKIINFKYPHDVLVSPMKLGKYLYDKSTQKLDNLHAPIIGNDEDDGYLITYGEGKGKFIFSWIPKILLEAIAAHNVKTQNEENRL